MNSAVTTQALLALYLQVVEWIPLGRWNNIANGNGQESTDIILAVLQIAILAFFWRRWRWAMVAGAGLYCFWLYLEVKSLWMPYVRGASPSTMRFYGHWFANTYKILPPIDGRPVPDAEHTVILLLLLAVLYCCVVEIYRAFTARRP